MKDYFIWFMGVKHAGCNCADALNEYSDGSITYEPSEDELSIICTHCKSALQPFIDCGVSK